MLGTFLFVAMNLNSAPVSLHDISRAGPEAEAHVHTDEAAAHTAHIASIDKDPQLEEKTVDLRNINSAVQTTSKTADEVKLQSTDGGSARTIITDNEAEKSKSIKQARNSAENNHIRKQGPVTHSATMETGKAFYHEYPVVRLQSRRPTAQEQSQHNLQMRIEYKNVSYNVILNNHLPPDLKFLQDNETFCEQRKVDILFYIISAPHHVAERQQTRDTWAKTQTFNNQTFSALFFIGRTESLDVQKQLKQEFLTHGDVIQVDMKDSYRNLTLKCIGAVKWMTTHCSNVKYVIKADDDLVVDVRHFADVINMQIIPENAHQPKLLCAYKKILKVLRVKTSKWHLPPNLLPGLKNYPPYCSGGFYGYPGFLLPKMYQATMLTPLFWLEDVYFTGFIVPQLQEDQLRYVSIREVLCDSLALENINKNICRVWFDVNTKTYSAYWKMITQRESFTL